MASRALAFSDPEVIRLLSTRFIPVAENCSPLQTQADAKGEFFRLIAEQGHYAGRTVPSATRQGQYAATADGRLLASINTREAGKLLGMLHEALERWQRLESAGAGAGADVPASYARDPRHPARYPEGGLVLKVTSRDLPRPDDQRPAGWPRDAVNFDYAWFTVEEARQFLPEEVRPGAEQQLPWPLVRRLARFHLLDNVRGETPAWREGDALSATIQTTVLAVEGGRAALRLDGTVSNATHGTWALRPFGERRETERGYEAVLRGRLLYNLAAGRFHSFRAVATGPRWGGSEHNIRWEDMGPAPLGIAFELAGDSPAERTPPHANLWDYFGQEAPR